MFRVLVTAGLFLILVSAATAEDKVPASCQQAFETKTGWLTCFDDAEPESGPWYLAAINLGTNSFYAGDNEGAAYYYGLSNSGGMRTHSDVILHAHRSYVFRDVGRLDEAVDDAISAWAYVQTNEFYPGGPELDDESRSYILRLILETLYQAKAEEFETVLDFYLAIAPSDEYDRINRAGLLTEIGKYSEALPFVEAYVEAYPDRAEGLNTICYLLSLMGRHSESIPYCEKAVSLEPEIAAIRHSYALALAGSGQCQKSVEALAEAKRLEPSAVLYDEVIDCLAP